MVQIIVGAEYIACTHCPIIVGAAAPTEPMVPTLMVIVIATQMDKGGRVWCSDTWCPATKLWLRRVPQVARVRRAEWQSGGSP